MSEIDEAIAEVKRKAEGRTRYEGQPPYRDEVLVAEIERLQAALKDIMLLDGKRLTGRQKFDHAFTLATRALEQQTGNGK